MPKKKLFEVHVNGHTTVEISANDEDEAREKAEKFVHDHMDQITWDIDIDEADDITPDEDE